MDACAFLRRPFELVSVRQGLQVPVAFASAYGGKSPGDGVSQSRVRETDLWHRDIQTTHGYAHLVPNTFVTL